MAETESALPALTTGDAAIPRLKMGEIGLNGLKVSAGQILEQSRQELRWPQSVRTFKEMSQDSTISAALKVVELMISRVSWDVEPPEGNTDPMMEAKAEFVEQCMHDMTHSWSEFIKEVVSMFTYGFAVQEKVFRKRYKASGSKYNDGLIGLKRLPTRSQDSVSKWVFSEDGRDLIGVEQTLGVFNNASRYGNTNIYNLTNPITIPRNKFLLFRTDVKKDNPEGTSPLVNVYTSWRFRKELEEIEAVGYSRNMGGVPHLELHPKYMAEDASESDRAVFTYYKKVIRNLHNNEQAGLITPLMYDPESKQPYFKFSLLSVQNSGSQYIHEAINRWDNKILTALFCDVLRLGQDKVGSFSLADAKTSILAMVIESRLKEIQDVLNNDLIPSLFKMNGWDDEELPKFYYGDLDDIDLEAFSKAVQRIKAVGLITPTAKNVNHIAEVLKLPDRVDENMSQEELNQLLGPDTSRSGDGMAAGMGNGTSTKVAVNDNSSTNTENKG